MDNLNTNSASENFVISDNAAKRIKFLLSDEKPNSRLRIMVEGGGCNGFQYKFDFDTEVNSDDVILTKNEAEVVIDQTSLDFLKGSIFEYIETLGASHFEVKNPNAASSCGCGNSFSVK